MTDLGTMTGGIPTTTVQRYICFETYRPFKACRHGNTATKKDKKKKTLLLWRAWTKGNKKTVLFFEVTLLTSPLSFFFDSLLTKKNPRGTPNFLKTWLH